jgi:hypothetical protein
MCEICKGDDTHLSPQLSFVYVHYKVILFVYCVYALVLLVQYCISVVETLEDTHTHARTQFGRNGQSALLDHPVPLLVHS